MAKWEYAAIIRTFITNVVPVDEIWHLVKPAETEPLIWNFKHNEQGGGRKVKWTDPISWGFKHSQDHQQYLHSRESALEHQQAIPEHWEFNTNDESGPEILYEAPDVLTLVNIAGAEGWEITGGIGLGDNAPGNPETRWRIMRREM